MNEQAERLEKVIEKMNLLVDTLNLTRNATHEKVADLDILAPSTLQLISDGFEDALGELYHIVDDLREED